MKKIVAILLMMISFVTVAQEKKSKNKKAEFKVNGNCEMCEKRIEKAAFSVKGVKSADWHVDHHDIHLIYDENKCSLEDIKKAIAKAGHDTEDIKAT
ncbi:MAG: heavy-metal-associated domain-containing protein, partial [Ignavibacteriae bacterium]|nr:heavy-metal-associated domain-containing protein [Ignavibacteriota bacterium]